MRVSSAHFLDIDAKIRKPFAAVATAIGMKKQVTPKAMRRTFQDLACAAEVKDIVTRAIAGHATSSVGADEKKLAIAKVIELGGAPQSPRRERVRRRWCARWSTWPETGPGREKTSFLHTTPPSIGSEGLGFCRVIGVLPVLDPKVDPTGCSASLGVPEAPHKARHAHCTREPSQCRA